MQKIVRLFIFYIAIVTTVLLGALIAITRRQEDFNINLAAKVEAINQALINRVATNQTLPELTQNPDQIAPSPTPNLDTTQVLGIGGTSIATQTAETHTGFVMVSDAKWQSVNVYMSDSYSSEVIGQLEMDKTYYFLKKIPNWYSIQFTPEKTGFVAARFVKETTSLIPQ